MAYKPRWIETESEFSGSEDNMLFIGPNGKIQDTSRMTFDSDDGNGTLYVGQLGNAVKNISAVADTTFSVSVTDVFTYVNSITLSGPDLTIQVADSPGNISQSNLEMTRTGVVTISSQNDASEQMNLIVDSGVNSRAFTFEVGAGNTELIVNEDGLALASGPAINEISNDSGADSTSILMTSAAIQGAIQTNTSINTNEFSDLLADSTATAIQELFVDVDRRTFPKNNAINTNTETRIFAQSTLKDYNKIEVLDITNPYDVNELYLGGVNPNLGTKVGAYFFNDGNILYTYIHTSQLYYEVRTSDGTSVISATVLNTNSPRGAVGVTLPNGNVAIMVYEGSTSYNNLVLYQFNSSGDIVLNRTIVKNLPNTTSPANASLKALPGGDLISFYIRANPSNSTQSNIYYIKFTKDGELITDETQFSFDNDIYVDGQYHNTSVAKNGNVAVVWRPYNSANRYIKIIDQNENTVVDKTLIASDGATAIDDTFFKITAFNNGRWIFVYYNGGISDRLEYKILDGYANILAEDVFPDESGSGQARRWFNVAITPEDTAYVAYIDWTNYVASSVSPDGVLAEVDSNGNQLGTKNWYNDGIYEAPNNDLNINGLSPNGQMIVTSRSYWTGGTFTSGYFSQVWRGTGTKVNGNMEVVGSLTVETLIADASSVIIGNTTLTEKSGGGLLVNGEEVGGGGTTINNIINEGDSVSPFPQDIQNNSIHTMEEYLQVKTIQYEEKFAVTNYDTNGSGATKAVSLKNGNFFIAYYDGSEGKYQIRKSDGTQVKAATTFETNTVNFLDLCLLPDGKVFLAYDDDSNNETKYITFDDQGNILYSATWSSNIYDYTTCATFPNGNVLIAGANSGSEKGQYQIFSVGSDGTTSNVTEILDFSSSEAGEMRSTTMQNGNVLVLFENVSQGSCEFFVSDSNGNIVVDVITIDDSTPDSLDCCTLRNGHVFLFFYVDNDEALKYFTIDNEGNTLFSGTYSSDTYLTDDQSVACTELPDGNVMVSYIDTNYDIFMAIIDEEANTVLAESTITSTSNLALQDAELATSKNGSVFFGVTDVTGAEVQNAKYTVFAGSGLKINGSLEVTDATSITLASLVLSDGGTGSLFVNGSPVGGGGGGLFTEDSDNNIIGGTDAGSSIVGGSGTNNFLAGVDAGLNVTTGDRNILIGNFSGDGFDTGSNNVSIGHQALRGFGGNPSGCIAIGYQAMGSIASSPSSCIAIGFQALQQAESASSNIGIGSGAGSSITSGDNNVIIGDTAGNSLTTQSGCVFIGYNAGLNETSSDKLHIANNQTESLIEGDFSARTAHVNGTFTAEKVEAFSGSVITGDSTAITNQVILANASGGAVTVDLVYEENAYIVVKKTDASVNAVTIQGDDGKTIDGAATKSLTTQYAAFTLFGFNDVWHII